MAPKMSDTKELNTPAAPGLLRMALELRAPWELAAGLAGYPLMRKAPRGDGHPVLVFPGLAAGDLSTLPLRRFLAAQGFAVHAWGRA
ncbi:hypothetical protein [Rugamonas sp. DEMB1]|uniref:hypothetical protein n=1 Tax=Rugamonas sp. DEMB1 TaxID=3039386 RepID=UPI0028BE2592|nr:hypothetical protein [Rugamonas sp. DEMB1]